MTRPQHIENQENAEIRRKYDSKCPNCGTRYYTYVKLGKEYNKTRQRISQIVNNPPKV